MDFKTIFSFSSYNAGLLMKSGQKIGGFFGCRLLHISPEHTPANVTGKILIVVPKTFGNAPKRNQIKRKIKAIIYEEKLFEREGVFVIICYAALQKYDSPTLRTKMKELFKQ